MAGVGRFLLGAAALWACLAGGIPARAEPKKQPPPPPGMRWESSLAGALERSKREGRPLLVCVNALENEGANIRLATELYPSQPWGRAARGFVCLVANPNDHPQSAEICSRYGHAACACHKETLAWVLRRFSPSGDLISPQHLILEPDGAVAYRKEYFTGEEGPTLFETYLTRLAPFAALRIARVDREARLAELAKAPVKEVEALAASWLKQDDDGLAALGVVAAWEETSEPARRASLLAALASTRPAQALGLQPWLEGGTAQPDGEPREALAWVRALLQADRALGLYGAARVLARSREAGVRADVLEAVTGSRDGREASKLPLGERAQLEEALRLAGMPPPAGLAPSDEEGLEEVPLARRLRARARNAKKPAPLPERFAELPPGPLRAALLGAAPADVSAHAKDLGELLRGTPYPRVRTAAALALLSAGQGGGGAVASTLLEALLDPLEGPETRKLAVARLGEDPGEDPEEWARVLAAKTGGAK